MFIGQAEPEFSGELLGQDSSRTWLVFKDTATTHFKLDVLDIRGYAHLALQNDGTNITLTANEYKGDFTGTLHIGKGQSVDVAASNNSVVPFNLRTYKVGPS